VVLYFTQQYFASSFAEWFKKATFCKMVCGIPKKFCVGLWELMQPSTQASEVTSNSIADGIDPPILNVFAVEPEADTAEATIQQSLFVTLLAKEPFLFVNGLYSIFTFTYYIASVVQLDSDQYSSWDKYQIFCLYCANSTITMFFVVTIMKRFAYDVGENEFRDLAKGYRPELKILTTLSFILMAPLIATHVIPGICVYIWYFFIYLAALLFYSTVVRCCIYMSTRDSEFYLDDEEEDCMEVLISVMSGRIVLLVVLQSSVSIAVLFYQQRYGYLENITEEVGIRHYGCFYENNLDTTENALAFFSFL